MGASYTLGRLAEALGATLVGDPDRLVTGVAPLDKAGPEHVSFLVNSRYLRAAAESAAGAVMVGPGIEGLPQALLRVDSAPVRTPASTPAPRSARARSWKRER